MTKRIDLRTSLTAKCAAIVLLLACAAGVAAGTVVLSMRSVGYGAHSEFVEDPLCTEYLNGAASTALYYTTGDRVYHANVLEERYGGFAAKIYRNGELVETWGEVPEHILAQDTYNYYDFEQTESGGSVDYTVECYSYICIGQSN